MENNMKPCPNCGQNVSNIAVMCPNCKYDFLSTNPLKTPQTPEAKPSGVKNLLRTTTDKTKALVKAENQKRTELNQLIKDQSTQTHTTLQISTGFQQIHTSSVATMYQRPDGTIYFNRNASDRYILLDYMWNGPRFNTITNTVSNTNTTSKTKGKSGKMAAGAVVGTLLMPGVGTAVGAAVGAGGKKKKKSQSITTNNTVQQSQELNTPATLRLKNINSNEYISIVISCNTVIDSQIKCFQFMPEQSKPELAKDTTNSLKEIITLKELLDMGAITQEEFETKKRQLLSN